MCACGFQNINETKILDESLLVCDGNSPKLILEYLQFLYSSYIQTFKKNIENYSSADDVINIILHSLYFQSKIDFFIKYCTFDISQHINTFIAKTLCGNNFCGLIEVISIEQENTIKNFQNQKDLHEKIGLEIYQNKNKLTKILPLLTIK